MANKKNTTNTTTKGTTNRWDRWGGGVKATPVKLSDVKLVNKPTKKK